MNPKLTFTFSLPSILNSELVYEGYMKIRKDFLQRTDGKTFHYENLLLKPISVMVLAQDEQNRFILNQEYRHPTGEILLGCPGGVVDEGETPCEAGRRELLEETGYDAVDFQIIGQAYPAPGLTGQKAYYLLAKGARLVQEPQLEPSELVTPVALHYEEITRLVREGIALDGLLAAALFFYAECK